MEALQIFDINGTKISRLANEKELFGRIYLICTSNGIKIGSSKNVAVRLKQLKKSLSDYGNLELGNIYVSRSCTNYRENEKMLHDLFKHRRRQGTELFDVDMSQALAEAKKLSYLDRSAELKKESAKVSNFFINLTINGGV